MFTTLYINRFGTVANNKKDAFLQRTIIFRNRWFSLFLHRFIKSDSGPQHDHPFHFISFLIKGSYIEEIHTLKGIIEIERKAPSIAFRDAFMFHRIRLNGNNPWTLCLTLNGIKNWSFMTDEGPVKWRKFLKKSSSGHKDNKEHNNPN